MDSDEVAGCWSPPSAIATFHLARKVNGLRPMQAGRIPQSDQFALSAKRPKVVQFYERELRGSMLGKNCWMLGMRYDSGPLNLFATSCPAVARRNRQMRRKRNRTDRLYKCLTYSLRYAKNHAQLLPRSAAMQFGLYLKNKGVISSDQLVAALEVQLGSLVPIGQLALEENVLSPRDIFTVLQAQSDSPNERFGDLAVEMGLMTRGHLMRLLMIQADRKRAIADILISQGALTAQKAATEMAAYRREQLRPNRTRVSNFALSSLNRDTVPMRGERITV
jgi:hypothetical protein